MGLNQGSQDLIFIEATGFSMWPFLRAKDKLVIKKVQIKELKIGDLILYHLNNQKICHRIVEKIISKDKYLIYARGDNNSKPGTQITADMLIGKGIGIIRNGRITNLSGSWPKLINRLIALLAPYVSDVNRGAKRLLSVK